LPDRKRDRPTQNRYDERAKVQPSVMTQITLTEAQQHLTEIISGLQPGEEVQILQDDRPIARLTLESTKIRKPRIPGSAIGTLTILTEDKAHLEDFGDYMP
jgi:antitoxin (DNA-binding transcriptional repressor) of toxin-antitoxin stability system